MANEKRRKLNVLGEAALDLRTRKASGEPWDCTRKEDRQEALRMVEEKRPTWVIGSPPCTAFSRLSVGWCFPRMPTESVAKMIEAGRMHLYSAIAKYTVQLVEGLYFFTNTWGPNCKTIGCRSCSPTLVYAQWSQTNVGMD